MSGFSVFQPYPTAYHSEVEFIVHVRKRSFVWSNDLTKLQLYKLTFDQLKPFTNLYIVSFIRNMWVWLKLPLWLYTMQKSSNYEGGNLPVSIKKVKYEENRNTRLKELLTWCIRKNSFDWIIPFLTDNIFIFKDMGWSQK